MAMIEKIRFFRVHLTPDPMGGSISTEETIWEPQGAEVREMRPSTELIATQQNISQVIRIRCRYNPEIAIKIGDKIEWRGFTFNSLLPTVDRRTRMMEIMAVSEIETTDREVPNPDNVWDGGSANTVFGNIIDGGKA